MDRKQDPMRPLDSYSDDELARLLPRAKAALPDAPPAMVRAVIDLWPAAAKNPLAAMADAAFKRISAVLSFDSWAAGAVPAGVRSVPSASRHLLFSAMGRDIDLRIAPAADRFSLSGQVLGPDESGKVQLVSQSGADAESTAQVVALDDLGEFHLDGVAVGTYLLTVRVGSDEIVLPPIEVGEQRP